MPIHHLKTKGPYKIDDLLVIVNSYLKQVYQDTITLRGLKYYIHNNIIPKPSGKNRLARYGYEHVVGLIACRMYQDKGFELKELKKNNQIFSNIDSTLFKDLEQKVIHWLEDKHKYSPQQYYISHGQTATLNENNPNYNYTPGEFKHIKDPISSIDYYENLIDYQNTTQEDQRNLQQIAFRIINKLIQNASNN